MEVTTTARMTNGSPLNIPEILDIILLKQNIKPLPINARLVCRTWNESWLRTYAKRPENPPKDHTNKIQKLYSILKSSNNALVFFRSLNCVWSNPVQNLFKEYGWSLKCLHLTCFPIQVSQLLSILVDLCPNLEEVKLVTFGPTVFLEDLDIENSQFKGRTLPHLKRLTWLDTLQYLRRDMNIFVIKWIIKASVNLKSLHFISKHSPAFSLKMIKEIDEDPEVKIRLDELRLDCNCIPGQHPLTIYLEIGLIANLKSLTLDSLKPFPKLEIMNILKKLSGTLESLTLSTSSYDKSLVDTLHQDGENSLKFPYMPKLKILNNYAYGFLPLESSGFLTKLPNLERLTIALNSKCCSVENGTIDRLFSILSSSRPHLALKELIVMGRMRHCVGVVSHLFPKLSKLYIGLNLNENLLKAVVSNFAGMEKLEDLTVAFNEGFDDDKINISKVLETVAPSNEIKLRYLTIMNSQEQIVGDWFVEAIPHLLNQLPKLLSLRLFKFYMEIPTTVRFVETLRSLENSNTRLEYLQVDPKNEFCL